MRRAIALLISAILFVSMLVVGIAPKTQAQGGSVTLFTSAFDFVPVLLRPECTIVNAGNATETVVIEMFAGDGTSLASTSMILAPGHVGETTIVPLSNVPVYCKFTVPSKGNFRASIVVLDFSTPFVKELAALPAF